MGVMGDHALDRAEAVEEAEVDRERLIKIARLHRRSRDRQDRRDRATTRFDPHSNDPERYRALALYMESARLEYRLWRMSRGDAGGAKYDGYRDSLAYVWWRAGGSIGEPPIDGGGISDPHGNAGLTGQPESHAGATTDGEAGGPAAPATPDFGHSVLR
jgi:hypothetical protein